MSDKIDKESPDYMFGHVLAKLEAMDDKNDSRHTEVMTRLDSQDKRIGKLEKIKQWAIGGAAVGSSGGAVAWWKNLFGGGAG